MNESLVGFCSAPWTDCITYADGSLKACDRNDKSFGNWQKDGLKNTWNSKEFQEFRLAMAEGRYPDSSCASCHNNGTQRMGHSSLGNAFTVHYEYLLQALGQKGIPDLANFYGILEQRKATDQTDFVIAKFFKWLEEARIKHHKKCAEDPAFLNALLKLQVAGETHWDFLHGVLKPRRVAPFRQSQLQAKCNARCMMCVGRYTGEIMTGPTMDLKFVDESFAEIEDVVDFWCNGSEFLLYRDWRKIALMLHEKGGTKLRVSTNGILLTEDNVRFMIDNKLLRFLTLSLDAATKETTETTRINVKFDQNWERIRFLFRYATEKKYFVEFTAAFVVMKRNFHELPLFAQRLREVAGKDAIPRITILPQFLENMEIEGYRRWVHKEHHALVPLEDLREAFLELKRVADENNILVQFYNQKMEEFVKEGMPFPKYFVRAMDRMIFLDDMEKGTFQKDYILPALAVAFPGAFRASAYGYERMLPGFEKAVLKELERNEVVCAVFSEFSDVKERARQEIHKAASAYVDEQRRRTGVVCHNGIWFFFDRDSWVKDLDVGAVLVDVEFHSVARVRAKFPGGFALLSDGRLIQGQRWFHSVVDARNSEGFSVDIRDAAPKLGRFREARLFLLGIFFSRLHIWNKRLLGGVKSRFLWELSLKYRGMLGALGLKVITPPVQASSAAPPQGQNRPA